jgi:hypothetical protein
MVSARRYGSDVSPPRRAWHGTGGSDPTVILIALRAIAADVMRLLDPESRDGKTIALDALLAAPAVELD